MATKKAREKKEEKKHEAAPTPRRTRAAHIEQVTHKPAPEPTPAPDLRGQAKAADADEAPQPAATKGRKKHLSIEDRVDLLERKNVMMVNKLRKHGIAVPDVAEVVD